MAVDIRKIKKLIELIQETGVGEIEIHEGEESVRISRQPSGDHAQHILVPSHSAHSHVAPPPAHAPAAKSETPVEEETQGHVVTSPMVGTCYLAPTPGADPFVKVGQHIKEGQTICVVEAMKMFNQIEADKSGVISARLIENEQPVEYGQPLFVIDDA